MKELQGKYEMELQKKEKEMYRLKEVLDDKERELMRLKEVS